MNNRHLILLTTTWPFDYGETFIDEEAKYLSESFSEVDVFPLFSSSGKMRIVPDKFTIHKPALRHDSKCKWNLLIEGVFSTAPLFFAIKYFFKERAYKPSQIWYFFTALLIFRASYPTLRKFKVTENNLVYSYWGDKWALSLPFLKTASGCKCVARFHGSDLYEEVTGYIPFRKMLFDSLDSAFPISNTGAEYITNRYGFKKLNIARLGVSEAIENPPANNKCFKIVSCSNAVPVKRLDIIAKALPMLDFPVQWTHIGDGPTLSSIKDLTKNNPPHISVNFKGRLSNSDVRKLYVTEHFDLFINVSESEGVPVSIMEAFASGIPVIATNVGGTAEIVDKSVGTLISKDTTPEILAETIKEIKDSELGTYRINAKERWASMCNAKTNYKAFVKLLLSV